MRASDGVYKRADYSTFSVGPAPNYTLALGGFSSDEKWRTGDSFGYSAGAAFSARDHDADGNAEDNCADDLFTAGWFLAQT